LITPEEFDHARTIARACYGVVPEITPLSGSSNAVFRLRLPDRPRILKISRGERADAVRKEIMLIDLVGRHGVPVPVIERADETGEMVGRAFLVMASAGTETVADRMRAGTAAVRNLFTEMGVVQARIHSIAFERSGEIRADGIVPHQAGRYVADLYVVADRLVADGLLDARDAKLYRSLPVPDVEGTRLCHSDFHAVQCIVSDDRIAAVVDWESAWSGNPTVDFALTQAYLELYSPLELVHCFASGYLSASSLPSDYQHAYLPVRMALPLSLLGVWRGQGEAAWAHAVRQRHVRRAVDLFRGYARRWERPGS
jgi:aminoglycoside phosphotransferase (APT) family kinase protein